MHIPAMDVVIPSNTMVYFGTLIPIVTFDLLNDIDEYNDFVAFISRSKINKNEEFRRLRYLKEEPDCNETTRSYEIINISDQL